MTVAFTIIALLGLIVFVIFAVFALVGPTPRRAQYGMLWLVGLIIWAVASIVLILDGLL